MTPLDEMTEPELRNLMNAMARAVENTGRNFGVTPKPYFTLLVWNDPKIAQYVSNCERHSMIAAIRETADRLEQKEDVTR
jgi:hypothetical protein